MKSSVIADTESLVRTTLGVEGTGHDWWHCARVRNTAVGLAREEDVDMLVVELGALLHDIADHKLHGGDREKGPRMAREWLTGQGVETKVVGHVVNIVTHMSWSKSHAGNMAFDSLEMRIVQDADRLGCHRRYRYCAGFCVWWIQEQTTVRPRATFFERVYRRVCFIDSAPLL